MQIILSPVRMDAAIEASLRGHTLTVNGVDYNFSAAKGDAPLEDHGCPWVVGPVSRVDGELHLTLILPHGPNPPHETLFPDDVILNAGPVPLPPFDRTPSDDESPV